MIEHVAVYLRAREWLSSKVVLMLAVCGLFVFSTSTGPVHALVMIGSFFLFVAAFLSVSYVVNDFCDREVDRLAGKRKIIADLPTGAVMASIGVLVIIGCVPALILSPARVKCLGAMALIYALGLAYSVPGIRFKERGALGLFECAMAQRCAPLLLIPCLLGMQVLSMPMFYLWLVISCLDGLRYILIHQIVDRENDERAGVRTYVRQSGRGARSLHRIIVSATAAEAILCLVALIPIAHAHPVIVGVGIAAAVMLELCIRRVLNHYACKDWFATFDSVPLEAYLSFIFPCMIGAARALTSWDGLAFTLAIVLLSAQPMRIKLELAALVLPAHRAACAPPDGSANAAPDTNNRAASHPGTGTEHVHRGR